MPPKVKFTKDEIIQAALNVARVKGASSVSTRDIAAELQAFYHLDEAAAERYAFDMLLVAHGLASLIVSGACSYTDEQIRRIFTHYSLALCKAYKEVPGFTDDTYDREAVFGALVPHGKA